MQRFGDTLLGIGARPGTDGNEGSLFVLGPRGVMFAVLKAGRFGTDIEQFGDVAALRPWDVRHRYLEFVDLDE